MHKDGSVLIEVLVATMIASMISAALFAAYYQVNRATNSLENNIDYHSRIMLVKEQLMQDLSGACLPQEGVKDATQKKQYDEKDEKITHIFYGVTSDKQFKSLTLITNNPLQTYSYWDGKSGAAKASIARVTYRLTQDPHKQIKKRSFILTRQETQTLSYKGDSAGIDTDSTDNQRKHDHFELIKGIKSMTIMYGALIKKNENESGSLTFFAQWPPEEKEKTTGHANQKEEDSDNKIPEIPELIVCTITLWDLAYEKEKSFIIKIGILPNFEKPTEKKSSDTPNAPPPQSVLNLKISSAHNQRMPTMLNTRTHPQQNTIAVAVNHAPAGTKIISQGTISGNLS